jgi:hypothetical protein
VYWKLLKNGEVGGKGVRESNGRVEQTKVKHTHSGIDWDIPLNIKLNINNENQDCKIGTVCGVEGVLLEGIKEIKEGD